LCGKTDDDVNGFSTGAERRDDRVVLALKVD
jgi:hypothetical protein